MFSLDNILQAKQRKIWISWSFYSLIIYISIFILKWYNFIVNEHKFFFKRRFYFKYNTKRIMIRLQLIIQSQFALFLSFRVIAPFGTFPVSPFKDTCLCWRWNIGEIPSLQPQHHVIFSGFVFDVLFTGFKYLYGKNLDTCWSNIDLLIISIKIIGILHNLNFFNQKCSFYF